MEEPENPAVEAAKGLPNNDRPAPEAGLGSFVGAFAPGQGVRLFQEGTAVRLPAGSTLVFQMHYTASGTAVTDQSTIGFVFAKTPPKQEAIIAALTNANFTIPAGAANVKVDAEMSIERDITVWSLLPHTHVRGRAWKVDVTFPNGREETVLAVPGYDFNWQTDYIFKEPLKLPRGSKLRTSAWYDNSSASKTNPDPSIDVHWGEQTWQEMQFTGFVFTVDPVQSAAQQQ